MINFQNGLLDSNHIEALDHNDAFDSDDSMSRKIFALVVGPDGKVQQGELGIGGESIDIVPTIAHILGFDHELHHLQLPGKVLDESFS